MTKDKRVIRGTFSIVLGIAMLIAFVLLGQKDWQKEQPKDNLKFFKSYPKVTENNVFVYRTLGEINKILESGSGIVFLGFPSCQWCQAYVPYVNEVAKEMQINEIYYFDIYHDRTNNSKDYQKTVTLLGDKIPLNDQNERRIYVPSLTVVKDGKILNYNDETALIFTTEKNPTEKYWTEEKVKEFKNTLRRNFTPLSSICVNCNE